MRKRSYLILSSALATFVAFLAASAVALTRAPWLHDRLRDIVAHEAARALSCEVAVGPLEGSVWHGLTIHGLAVARTGRLADGQFLRAETVDLTLSLPRLLRKRAGLLSALDSLAAHRVYLGLVRGPTGRFLMPRIRPESGANLAVFPGPALYVADVTVRYTDHVLRSAEGRPLEGLLSRGQGLVQVGVLLAALRGRSDAPGHLQLTGDARVTCGAQSAHGRFAVTGTAARVEGLMVEDSLTGERAQAARLELEFLPGVLFARKRPPAEALRAVRVDRPVLELIRADTGDLSLLRQVRSWLTPRRDTTPLRVAVYVNDGALTLTDYAALGGDGPVRVTAAGVTGRFDTGRLWEALNGRRSSAGRLQAAVYVTAGELGARGQVETDLTTWATVVGFRSRVAGRRLADAARARVEYNLGALAGRSPGPALPRIEAEGLEAEVRLDQRNRPVALAQMLGRRESAGRRVGTAHASGRTKQPTASFPVGRLRLTDSNLTVVAQAVRPRYGDPLTVRLVQVTGDADLQALVSGKWVGPKYLAGGVELRFGDLHGAAVLQNCSGPQLQLTGLWVKQRRSEVVRVRTLRAVIDWRRLASAPAAAVQRVAAQGLRAWIFRGGDRRFEALACLPVSSRREAGHSWRDFAPRVSLREAELLYADLGSAKGLNVVRAVALQADVDLRRLWAATAGRRIRGIGTLSGALGAFGPKVSLRGLLTANLDGRLEMRDATVREPGGEASAHLGLVRASFAPASAYQGRVAEAVTRLALQDGSAYLVREADGQWSLIKHILGVRRASRANRGPAQRWFGPVVEAKRLQVRLTDHSVANGPLEVTLGNVHGRAAVGRPSRGRLTGSVWAHTPWLSAVARVTTDLASVAEARDLRVREQAGRHGRQVLEARTARAAFSAAELLNGGGLAAIQRLGLWHFTGHLEREVDGRLQMARLLPRGPASSGDTGRTATFRGVVEAAGGTVTYTDRTPTGGPITLRAERLRGKVHVGRVLDLARGSRAERTPDLGWAQARVTLHGPTLEASSAAYADLGRLISLSDLAAYQRAGGRRALMAWAARARVWYWAAKVFGGQVVEALQRLELDKPTVALTRNRAGKLEQARLLRGLLPSAAGSGLGAPPSGGQSSPGRGSVPATSPRSPASTWGRLAASVRVRDGIVHYTDFTPARQPLRVTLRDLNGETAPGQIAALIHHQTPQTESTLTGEMLAEWEGAQARAGFSTDLRAALLLREVAVAAVSAGGPRLAAQRLATRVDLGAVFGGEAELVRAFSGLDIRGVQVDVHRDGRGRVDVGELFSGLALARGSRGGGAAERWWQQLQGSARFADVAVRFTDLGISREGPVYAELMGMSGEVALGRAVRLGREPTPGAVGQVSGGVRVRLPHGIVTARVASADVSRWVLLRDVLVTHGAGTAPSRVESARLVYDLHPVVAGEVSLAEGLKLCDLERAEVSLTRGPEGKLDWAALLGGLGVGQGGSRLQPEHPESLTARLRLRDSTLRYSDLAAHRDGPVVATLHGAAGTVHVGKALVLRQGGGTVSGLGSLQGTLQVAFPHGVLSGRLVSGDAAVQARLDDVRLVDAADGELAQAARVGVTFDLGRMVREPARWMEALRRCDLQAPEVRVVRAADGTVDLVRALGGFSLTHETARGEPRGGLWRQARARVHVSQGSVRFVDHAVNAEGPVEALVASLSGDVRLDRAFGTAPVGDTGAAGRMRGVLAVRTPRVHLQGVVVSPDVGRRVWLTDVTAVDRATGEVWARCSAARVSVDVPGLVADGAAWSTVITGADLDGPEVHLTRDAKGELNLSRLLSGLRLRGGTEGEGRRETRGPEVMVSFSGGAVDYVDRAANHDGPVRVRLDGAAGSVAFQEAVKLAKGQRPGAVGSVRGVLQVWLPHGAVNAGVSSSELCRQAVLSNTVVLDGAGHQVASARLASLSYDLGGAVCGGKPWEEAVSRCHLERPRVEVVREPGGKLSAGQLLAGFGAPEKGARAWRPAAVISVRDGELHLVDHHAGAEPIDMRCTGVAGQMAVAKLWAAREGRFAPGIGRVAAQVRVTSAREVMAGRLSWNLDGEVRVEQASIIQVDNPLPVLAVDRATVSYEPRAALGADGDIIGAVREVRLGKVWVQERRLRDGTLEPPRIVQAYRGTAAPGAKSRFLDGLAARVRAQSVSGVLEDQALDVEQPPRFSVADAAVDVRCDHLAALREGRRVASPGWARGRVAAVWRDLRADVSAVADLGGRAYLTDLVLAGEGGRRRVLSVPEAVVRMDMANLLSGEPTLGFLRQVSARGLQGDVVVAEDGKWEGARWLLASGPSPPRPGWSFGDFVARVAVQDGAVKWVDRRSNLRQPLLSRVMLTKVNGKVDFGALQEVRRTGVGRGVGTVQAAVRMESQTATLTGELDTDFGRRLKLQAVTLSTRGEGAAREVMAAEEVRVAAGLADMIAGEPFARNLQRVEVFGLRASLIREADGRLELQRLLSAGAASAPTLASAPLSGLVVLHPATVHYEDRSAQVEGGLSVVAVGLEGTVNLGAIQAAREGCLARNAGRLRGVFSGRAGRQYLAGSLEAELGRQITLRDVTARAGEQGPITAQATLIAARYNLPRMLRNEDRMSAVDALEARGLQARLGRHRDGSWEVLDGLSLRPAAAGKAGMVGFCGSLQVSDCDVEVADYSVGQGGRLVVAGHDLDAAINVGALRAMRGDGQTRPLGHVAGQLTVQAGEVMARAQVSGDPGRGLTASDVQVTGPGREPDRLAASRVVATYDLGPILAGQPWAPAVHYVGARDLRASILREPDGRLRLERQVREGLGIPPPSAGRATVAGARFCGRVAVQNGLVDYTDHALLRQAPLTAHFAHLTADLDFGSLRAEGQAGSGACVIRADVEAATPNEQLMGSVAGDLRRRVKLTDLKVLRRANGEPVVRAAYVAAEGVLADALTGSLRLASALRRVEVRGLDMVVRRDATGHVTTPELLTLRSGPTRAAAAEQPPTPVQTQVVATDAKLRLVDDGLLGDAGPLEVTLEGLGGSAVIQGQVVGGRWSMHSVGSLRATVRATTPDVATTAKLETDLARNHRLRAFEGVATDGRHVARAQELFARLDTFGLLEGEPLLQALEGFRVAGLTVALGERGQALTIGHLPVKQGEWLTRWATVADPVTDLTGQAARDRRGLLQGMLHATRLGSLAQEARAQFTLDPADHWVDAMLEAGRVDLGALGRALPQTEEARLLGGSAACRGFMFGHTAGEKGKLTWGIASLASQGQVRVARLGPEPLVFSGPLEVGSEGLRSPHLEITRGAVTATVQGSLYDWQAPLLALSAEVQATEGASLLGLLPEGMCRGVERLVLAQPALLTATVTGPVKDPIVELSACGPDVQVGLSDVPGSVRLRGAELRAFVGGLAGPSVRANLVAQQVRVEGSDDSGPGVEALPTELAQGTDVRASVLLPHENLGYGTLTWRTGHVWGASANEGHAVASLNGENIAVESLGANVLGGAFRAKGIIEASAGGKRVMRGRADLKGAQLAELCDAPWLPDDLALGGGLEGVASGAVGGSSTDWRADLWVTAPVINHAQLDMARAVVHGTANGAEVEVAQVAGKGGVAWARGMVGRAPKSSAAAEPTGGTEVRRLPMRGDLEVAVAEVPLDALRLSENTGEVRGVGYALGRLSGTLDDPDFAGRVVVFEPGYRRYQGTVAAARVERTGRIFNAPRVLASSGRVLAGASDVRVADFQLHADPTDPRRLAPQGAIRSGIVKGAASLAELARALGRDTDVSGWAYFTGDLGGTLRRPSLGCSLTAQEVGIKDFFVDEARLECTVQGDTLLLSDAYARAHGGELWAVGRVDDLYGSRCYSLVAAVPRIAVEDTPFVQRLRADASGTACVPYLALWGSRGTAPSGSAAFAVERLRIGADYLQPITGRMHFGGGLVDVSVGRIRRAVAQASRNALGEGGYVGLSAHYEVPRRFLDAEVRLSGPEGLAFDHERPPRRLEDLPELGGALRLASPLVAAIENALAEEADAGSVPAAPAGQPLSVRLARLGLRSRGRVTGRVRLFGPLDNLSARTACSVWDATVDGKPLPHYIGLSLQADLVNRRLDDIAAQAWDGKQYVAVEGRAELPVGETQAADRESAGRQVDLTVEAAEIQLPMWRDWLPGRTPLAGILRECTLQATGSSAAPHVEGSMTVSGPSYAGVRFDTLRLPLVEVREGAINIVRAKLIRREKRAHVPAAGGDQEIVDREITLQGSLPFSWRLPGIDPEGEVRFRADLQDMDLGFFPPILDEFAREARGGRVGTRGALWSGLTARGAVQASLQLSGPLRSPHLGGFVKLTGGSVSGSTWAYPLDDLQLDMQLRRENGRNLVQVATASGRWGTTRLSLQNARAILDHLTAQDLADNEYHANLLVASDKPMTVRGLTIGKLSGGISFNTQEVSQPAGAELRRTHELAFNDLTVGLGEGNIQVTGVGKLGDFSLAGFHRNEYDIWLKANSALVQYARRLRGELNGAVHLHRAPVPSLAAGAGQERVRLEGALTLDNAQLAYALPGEDVAQVYRGLSARYPSPELDVTLAVGRNTVVRGLGTSMPITPGPVAYLSQTLQQPWVRGQFNARAGSARLPTGALLIRAAKVSYDLRPRPDAAEQDRVPLELTGDIYLEGERLITAAEVPGLGPTPVHVYVTVTGKLPRDITVDVRSDPPLGKEQIVALMGAEPLGGLSVSGRHVETVLSEQALSALAVGFRTAIFEPLERELMRVLGLSEFSIAVGFNQAVDIRLGKYVLRDLLVSYQRRVSGAGEDRFTLGISYRLQSRLHVAYTTNELGDSRLKLTYEVGL